MSISKLLDVKRALKAMGESDICSPREVSQISAGIKLHMSVAGIAQMISEDRKKEKE